MNKLEIKYFGIPHIKLNNEIIHLPYAKAENIVYILAHDKSITRDKLCSLLWGNVNDKVAKKSLRNAVYIIRKNLYEEFILSPKRFLLEIDCNCKIITDTDLIYNLDVQKNLSEYQINNFIDIYVGDFLEGIDNKLTVELDEWLKLQRSKYRNLYLEKFNEIITFLMNEKEYDLAEICCKKYIELDEFDEKMYRNLITIYKSQKKLSDSIKVYKKLENVLRENLSIEPSIETRKMFEDISKGQISTNTTNELAYYGREKELELLNGNIVNFISNKAFKSYIIFGEAGIGKTRLLDKVIENFERELIIIRITCYEAESQFMFKLWDEIFEKISYIIKEKKISIPIDLIKTISKTFPTLNIDMDNFEHYNRDIGNSYFIENYIGKLFLLISKVQKIVFVIDDLNWADKNSLDLLCKVIFSNRYNTMIMASCRDEYSEFIEKFYFSLCPQNYINNIELSRFNNIETKNLVKTIMPEYTEFSHIIFKESEGNPLFITEMVNSLKQGVNISSITDKMATLISGRIVKLSSNGRKLLGICSMFYEVFDVKMLSKITNIEKLELIELIEELITKNILKEMKCSSSKCGLMFTHQKIREYVYNTVSKSKRIVLHEMIGKYYELKLNNTNIDRIYYPNLIYHFGRSDNKYKVFKYEVINMQVIFDVSHEIFPILEDKRYSGVFEYYTDEKLLEEKFVKLKDIYDELEFEKKDEIYLLQIIYLHLYGRFHKDIGNPVKGLDAINKMIDLSSKTGHYIYSYEGYILLIQYAINTNNLLYMKDYIKEAEKLSQLLNDIRKNSIVLRYKGYYNILKHNYEKGEEYIFKAIEIFQSLQDKDKYILNIAASYFYIGESKRMQNDYIEAIKYYNKAFEFCNEDKDFPAIAVIFSKIGYSKYMIEVYDEAQFYLLKSLKAYNKTIFAWGRAEVYYLLALIYNKKGMKEKSKNYIKGAMLFCDKYHNNDINTKAEEFLESI
ncbi:AAA family ATPase [Sedimentibacter sp. MB31-C6]|uniref:AAA family ATPase n=1 Tax=Sedimentibacter sp. MB31-C6 TaxID=3109366 RepID=UPI002DDCAE3E|nr:AAA family ATPase [Sedimentibacter sp. MB36-C1]WSI04897.1 AAA family ATPase [Sedimentibacter sp. MB36-C1]